MDKSPADASTVIGRYHVGLAIKAALGLANYSRLTGVGFLGDAGQVRGADEVTGLDCTTNTAY